MVMFIIKWNEIYVFGSKIEIDLQQFHVIPENKTQRNL